MRTFSAAWFRGTSNHSSTPQTNQHHDHQLWRMFCFLFFVFYRRVGPFKVVYKSRPCNNLTVHYISCQPDFTRQIWPWQLKLRLMTRALSMSITLYHSLMTFFDLLNGTWTQVRYTFQGHFVTTIRSSYIWHPTVKVLLFHLRQVYQNRLSFIIKMIIQNYSTFQ